MSHELLTNGDSAYFYEYAESGSGIAWHALGHVSSEKLNAVDAARIAGVDRLQIEKRPVQIHAGYTEQGNPIMVPDLERYALLRHPLPGDETYKIFGYVSEDYQFIQPMQLLEAINPLTEEWNVETIGLLKGGSKLFAALNAGKYAVKGKDELLLYYTLVDEWNGNSSLRMMFTPIRVVCQNTEVAATKAAVVSLGMRHNSGLTDAVEFRVALLKEAQRTQATMLQHFELMAGAILEDTEAKAVFELAYPEPAKPKKVSLLENVGEDEGLRQFAHFGAMEKSKEHWEWLRNQAQEYRLQVFDLYQQENEAYPALAQTAWHAYNAVTKFASHRESGTGRADTVTQAESVLFGVRAREMQRAYEAALSYSQN